jgi:predicted outer membrane repeat protein
LFTVNNNVKVRFVNFTENEAATNGGAVRCEAANTIYLQGAARFLKNIARGGHGGGISLEDSSLKTNEGALAFEANEARLGGALAGENGAAVNISTGCRTITFEMHWADSTTLEHAEDSNSIVIRRVRNANNSAVVSGDMIDERGEWTTLFPPSSSDTEVSFCLAPGKYEMIGSEGKYCYEGWGGGYVRAVDLEGSEILPAFTVQAPPEDWCYKNTFF